MSEGDTFWLSLAEKFFGLILTIVGVLFLYFTLTSTAALGVFTVLIIGVFLLLVRPPE